MFTKTEVIKKVIQLNGLDVTLNGSTFKYEKQGTHLVTYIGKRGAKYTAIPMPKVKVIEDKTLLAFSMTHLKTGCEVGKFVVTSGEIVQCW